MSKTMETMSISEFKATCLAVLERIRRTGRPLLITRRGKPIAEVIPPSLATTGSSWLGSMRGTAQIVGNIVEPAGSAGDWEVTRE
jgi:prevent-host-death family protein